MLVLAGVVDAEGCNVGSAQKVIAVVGRFIGGQSERGGGVAEEQQKACEEWFGGEHGFCAACFVL